MVIVISVILGSHDGHWVYESCGKPNERRLPALIKPGVATNVAQRVKAGTPCLAKNPSVSSAMRGSLFLHDHQIVIDIIAGLVFLLQNPSDFS